MSRGGRMLRISRQVRRALRVARSVLGLSAGPYLESDDSEDELFVDALDISATTGRRKERRARRGLSSPPQRHRLVHHRLAHCQDEPACQTSVKWQNPPKSAWRSSGSSSTMFTFGHLARRKAPARRHPSGRERTRGPPRLPSRAGRDQA